mmetsp:Transcript_1252/g.2885  ORF Transcript_1252/g.2885 Transcript_1252/m.2885 type:complete len:688 (+) Transcript_1252:118-2181(+)
MEREWCCARTVALMFCGVALLFMTISTPWHWGAGLGDWCASSIAFAAWNLVLATEILLLIYISAKNAMHSTVVLPLVLQIVGSVGAASLWALRSELEDSDLGTPDEHVSHRFGELAWLTCDITLFGSLIMLDRIVLDRVEAVGGALAWDRTTRACQILWRIEIFCCTVNMFSTAATCAADVTGSIHVYLWYRLYFFTGFSWGMVRTAMCFIMVRVFLTPVLELRAAARSEKDERIRKENSTLLPIARIQLVVGFVNACLCAGSLTFCTVIAVTHYRRGIGHLFFAGECFVNVLLVLVSSGISTQDQVAQKRAREAEELRKKKQRTSRQNYKPCADSGWQEAVENLALRGFTLEQLLTFYQRLPDVMPHFVPGVHTTNDVVRQVIIPESAEKKCAYSQIMTGDTPTRPKRMVTHNWSNRFRDLVAAIVADALHQATFSLIAELLDQNMPALRQMLGQKALSTTYWVCAFCVNQHHSICSENHRQRKDPITRKVYDVCCCGSTKYLNDTPPLRTADGKSLLCQMNKFSDMMAFLAAGDPDFAQVIAVDRDFGLFNRAWCVAELAEADKMGMQQHIKLVSNEALDGHRDDLQNLDVEQMQAARPEDVQEILAEIPDVPTFNAHLQSLLFGEIGLFALWASFDVVELAAEVGRVTSLTRARSRLSSESERSTTQSDKVNKQIEEHEVAFEV